MLHGRHEGGKIFALAFSENFQFPRSLADGRLGLMRLDDLRSSFTGVAAAAFDEAERSRAGSRGTVGTRDVLVALIRLDVSAEWDRLWLEFSVPESQGVAAVSDPNPDSARTWQGQPVTVTCAIAVSEAIELSEGSGTLPVSPGFFLCARLARLVLPLRKRANKQTQDQSRFEQ